MRALNFSLIRVLKITLTSLGITTIIGCATHFPKVPKDVLAKHPSNLPKAVVTNFNEALACMDNLMLLHEVAPVYIASDGLVNYTSDHSISSGGKEMLITALSKMSIRSNGIRFVSYGSDIRDMLTLQGAHPDHGDFRVPDFFIRGGVTQHNKSLWSGQRGAGTSVEIESPEILDGGTFFSLHGQEDFTNSYSMSGAYGTVTLDMSAGYIATLQIVPGVASANTLALENRKGKSISADLSLGDLGYSYSFSDNKSFDFNTVFRSLVQVGVIEIVGKLQGVPYWRCLSNAGAVEARDSQLLKQYVTLQDENEKQLIVGVQTVLKDLNYYAGPINGSLEEHTQKSLQAYQQHMGLIATGLINFQTYRMMNLFTPTKDNPTSYWWQNFQSTAPQAPTAATNKTANKQ